MKRKKVQAGWCFAVALTVVPLCGATTFYVSPTGSHNPPYDKIGKAATNIHAAVEYATNAGDTVIIQDGIYYVTIPVSVTNAITITSANGPANTIVNGGGVTHCFDLDDVNCTLSGLTVTNGFNSGDGGGIVCGGVSPVIRNCIVTGNYTMSSGGGIVGGTIHRSVIQGNTAVVSGGGISGTGDLAEVYDSLIVSNIVPNSIDIVYGGGVEFCNLYNCTVVGNQAPDAGGVDSSYLYNCIVYSNEAPENPDVAYSTLDTSCIGADGLNVVGDFIIANPLFVDAAAGNYRLQAGSPCVNTGDNIYVVNSKDQDGNPRIKSFIVDMGAYEFQTPFVDSDGDGWSDDEEGYIGTLPGDSASFPMVSVEPLEPDSFIVSWNAFPDRVYFVSWTDDLLQDFIDISGDLPYPVNSYTDVVDNADSVNVYRVDVEYTP